MGATTVIVALLACDNHIDDDKLEKMIVNMFDEQIGVEVKKVDCPKKVKIEKDKEFECEVSVKPDGKVPVTVEITDAENGSVEVKTKYKVIVPEKFKEKTGLDCGKKVVALKPGKTIKCKDADGKDVPIEVNEDGEPEKK